MNNKEAVKTVGINNEKVVKTVRIIPFSGKKEDWNRWSKTFLAIANTRQYKNELT